MATRQDWVLDSGWDASLLRAAADAAGMDYVAITDAMRSSGVKVHPMTVQRWLRGITEPKGRLLVGMARVLGTTAEAVIPDPQ